MQSRFVNTSGLPGKNIPADLHLEHLNRLCKESIRNLGANKTPRAIVRIGKSSQCIMEIQRNLSREVHASEESTSHTTRSQSGDLSKIVDVLLREKVFADGGMRCHRSFSTINCNLFAKINQKKFDVWLHGRFTKLLQTSTMNR